MKNMKLAVLLGEMFEEYQMLTSFPPVCSQKAMADPDPSHAAVIKALNRDAKAIVDNANACAADWLQKSTDIVNADGSLKNKKIVTTLEERNSILRILVQPTRPIDWRMYESVANRSELAQSLYKKGIIKPHDPKETVVSSSTLVVRGPKWQLAYDEEFPDNSKKIVAPSGVLSHECASCIEKPSLPPETATRRDGAVGLSDSPAKSDGYSFNASSDDRSGARFSSYWGSLKKWVGGFFMK